MVFQQILNGLTNGSIYALLAIGVTMIYKSLGMLNFAHGDTIMISAFICLTLITVGIPMIFYVIGGYIEAFRKYYLIQCVLYMLSGVLALLIVAELRKMFATVLKDQAFVWENAASLKRMGKCSFLIALLSVVRLPLAPTPATAVVIIVFSIAGLFCFVLCQVFEKAIQYKEENDLTI